MQTSVVTLIATELPTFSASIPPNLKNFHIAVSSAPSRQLLATPIAKMFSTSAPSFPDLASTTATAGAFAAASAQLAYIFASAISTLEAFAASVPGLPTFASAIPLPAPSEMTRKTIATAGHSSWGGRGSQRGKRSRGGRITQRGRNKSTPTPIRSTEDNQEHIEEVNDADDEEKPRWKPRNKNMTPQEKLVLIRKCCEHIDKYCLNNKEKFWSMI